SKPTPREKRRELLELLPRRGPLAFQAFCDALENDHVKQKFILDKLLGRAPTQGGATSTVSMQQLETGMGEVAISGASRGTNGDIALDDTDGPIAVRVEPSTERFFNEKTSNSQPLCYTMVKQPRGLAYVVSNVTFDHLSNRGGGDVDFQNITALLTQLGFEVRELCDKTASEIETGIQSFAMEEAHQTADCCVVVMMSHGKPEHIYGRDGQDSSTSPSVNIPTIISMFDNVNCPALRGKPKLFFFQACRGDTADRGTAGPDVPDAGSLLPSNFFENVTGRHEADVSTDQPTATDMLICYPTQLGNVSFRNASNGSWFIQAITKVFMKRAKDSTILSMMTEVNRLVSEQTSSIPGSAFDRGKQASEFINRLRKDLYFFPGITK
ncbi:PREDICTED: caspase-2-like, partial [Branchiostoma belcheri]|uniref:Caspase-2-like n=1 Tax=Branchiostoma belcheri TaxID=7741 RepID=A0A6P5AUK3_BRABE